MGSSQKEQLITIGIVACREEGREECPIFVVNSAHRVVHMEVNECTVRFTCEEAYDGCGGMKPVRDKMLFRRYTVRYPKSATKLP